MRLIDADKLRSEMENYSLQVEAYKRDSEIDRMRKLVQAVHDHAVVSIETMPPIDVETLPIVRQLREQLERVTAERDAAIKDIEAAMGSESTQNILKYLCSLCQNKDLNRGCTCDGKCAPKWRGAQKEE